MATTITFRSTVDDFRIIDNVRRDGENTSDVIRRALRALDREQWLQEFRADAARLADEDLSCEPDAW